MTGTQKKNNGKINFRYFMITLVVSSAISL